MENHEEEFEDVDDELSEQEDIDEINEDIADADADVDNYNLNSKVIYSIEESYSNYYKKNKTTKSFMTKFEKAKILGIRSDMLASGAEPMIDIPENITNCYEIAKLELEQCKIPLIVRRYLPNNDIEDWKVNDLIIR